MQIPGVDNAYCKFGTVLGDDWTVVNGLREGVTQMAQRGCGAPAFFMPLLCWPCLHNISAHALSQVSTCSTIPLHSKTCKVALRGQNPSDHACDLKRLV